MKRILVGLDGSARAPRVLAVATTIARTQGAKLVLLQSVGLPPDVPQEFWKTTDEPLISMLQRRSREYLDQQAATLPKELLDKTEVQIGVPWQSLCEAAQKDEADLIVVGSHGYTGLDHLLGTTASKVVNHAKCSVLVVRDPAANANSANRA